MQQLSTKYNTELMRVQLKLGNNEQSQLITLSFKSFKLLANRKKRKEFTHISVFYLILNLKTRKI